VNGLALPLALLVATWVGELATAGNAPRAHAKRRDRGSLLLSAGPMPVGYVLAFTLHDRTLGLPVFPAWLRWSGAPLCLAGVALRAIAIRTLGRWFTRDVQVSNDQPVIQHGPYAWVRHPSYTAIALESIGIGLALGTPLSLALMFLPGIPGGIYRILVEEAALLETIGEPYRDYMRRVKRLIPRVL